MTMRREPIRRGDVLKGLEDIKKLFNPETQDKELEKRIKQNQEDNEDG